MEYTEKTNTIRYLKKIVFLLGNDINHKEPRSIILKAIDIITRLKSNNTSDDDEECPCGCNKKPPNEVVTQPLSASTTT